VRYIIVKISAKYISAKNFASQRISVVGIVRFDSTIELILDWFNNKLEK